MESVNEILTAPAPSNGANRWVPSIGYGTAVAAMVLALSFLDWRGQISPQDLLRGVVVASSIAALTMIGGTIAVLLQKLRDGRAATLHSNRLGAMELRRLFESLQLPVLVTDSEHRSILFANARAREQFGVLDGASSVRDTARIYRDSKDREKLVAIVRQDGLAEQYTTELVAPDGSSLWAVVSARQVTVCGVAALACSFVDITERRATEEALLNSEVRYALISRAANDGIWDWDLSSGHVYYSSRWREIAGLPPNGRLNTFEEWLDLVEPEDRALLRHAVDEHLAGTTPQLDLEYRLFANGRMRWMHCRAIVLRSEDGRAIRMAGSQSDITLRKTYELNLRNAAYEDRLTGLGNRTCFTHLIDAKTERAQIAGGAVLLINVDQFKRVNDNLGTAAGDALLVALARRLAARVDPGDTIARLGGDEFAVYFGAIGDPASALNRCEAMLAHLAEPFLVGDAQVSPSLSAGLTCADIGGAASGADLMQNARLALDRSKQLGGNQCTLFDDSLLHENKLRQRLSRDLAHAGRLGQISLDYQPLVALAPAGEVPVVGFEALMRWRHPELGQIEPARFVPLAEDSGLIGSLGMLAIERAADAVSRWTASGLASDQLSIAVNLSVRQISDSLGIRRLFALLDRLDLPRGSLKLEITESVLMSDPDEMVKVLTDLRARGIGLSLDDFGTGFSSLSYLHRFPLDVLKVDRSFTAQMLRSPEALRLVRSIIDLGHDLGLTVVAEGVECAEEVLCLRDMRCDFAQGYYFSRPLPELQAERILIEGVRRPEPVAA